MTGFEESTQRELDIKQNFATEPFGMHDRWKPWQISFILEEEDAKRIVAIKEKLAFCSECVFLSTANY
jgi:hypothetical protein